MSYMEREVTRLTGKAAYRRLRDLQNKTHTRDSTINILQNTEEKKQWAERKIVRKAGASQHSSERGGAPHDGTRRKCPRMPLNLALRGKLRLPDPA